MPPPPVRDVHDLLRRALALGWRVTTVPGVGRRLVPPLSAPPHLADEAALIAAAVRGRLMVLLALLNADQAETVDSAAGHHAQAS